MVGDDADRNIVVMIFAVRFVRNGADRVKNFADGIDFKHIVDALHDAGEAFKTHAGVDVFLREFGIVSVTVVIEL